ncbi:MAG: YdcF family protein, partial [Coprobacillaceae bacterium]
SFVTIIIAIFFIVEGKFIYQSLQSHQNPSDFVIVLGAQVRGTSLSPSLKYRLDATLSYYEKHPTTTILVSGGQGVGEDDSEANIMKKYLVQNGIPQDKILTEDKSTTTYENLLYSQKILDTYKTNYTVTIITNGFHCYRALYIANALGYDAYTYAAKEYAVTTPHYYIREFFAYMKEIVLLS